MRKWIVGLATLFSVSAAFSVLGTQQERQEKTTRFGSLIVGEDKRLLFKGHPLNPSIEGNNSLNLGEVYHLEDADVVLVMDSGGTACPFLYYFVTVKESGAKATRAFGTCEELSRIKRTGSTFSVFMPGFRGPFESMKKREKAARETHVFTFRDGVVIENEKPRA